jgi:hypothetical protein
LIISPQNYFNVKSNIVLVVFSGLQRHAFHGQKTCAGRVLWKLMKRPGLPSGGFA